MIPNTSSAGIINFIAGEVLGVNYTDSNPVNMYSIRVKLTTVRTAGDGDTITARPMDSNFKKIPLVGEIAIVFKAPSSNSNSSGDLTDWYYISTLNVQGSVQHNALPGRSKGISSKNPSMNDYKDASAGNPETTPASADLYGPTNPKKKPLFGPGFIEKESLPGLQPNIGDILLESRFGSSIRFGSTINYPDVGIDVVSKTTQWTQSPDGDVGDPITIISNGHGQKTEPGFNKFKVEDINTDASAMWLTRGQTVELESVVKNGDQKAISAENNNSYKSGFGGNQAIIAADRIVFNARKDEVVMFANNGVSLGTNGSLAVDAGDRIHLNAPEVWLGLNPTEPAVLGDILVSLLQDILSQIRAITVPTGTGPSGIPLNGPAFGAISTRLKNCLSTVVAVKG